MPALLFFTFLVIPALEIYVIFRVGELIGWPVTILLLIAESLLGAWLVKREARTAWRALRQAWGTGRLPSRQLADGALVLVGGTLLLTPGFLTDIAGFAFVLPTTRPIARRILAWMLMSRLLATSRLGRAVAAARRVRTHAGNPGATHRANGTGAPGGRPPGATTVPPPAGRVVPGEVVDD